MIFNFPELVRKRAEMMCFELDGMSGGKITHKCIVDGKPPFLPPFDTPAAELTQVPVRRKMNLVRFRVQQEAKNRGEGGG